MLQSTVITVREAWRVRRRKLHDVLLLQDVASQATLAALLLSDTTAVAHMSAISIYCRYGASAMPALSHDRSRSSLSPCAHRCMPHAPSCMVAGITAGARRYAGQHLSGAVLQCLASVGPTLRQLGLSIGLTHSCAGAMAHVLGSLPHLQAGCSTCSCLFSVAALAISGSPNQSSQPVHTKWLLPTQLCAKQVCAYQANHLLARS